VPSMATPRADCPKRMVFGPCGGVRSDGGCEMAAMPCVFREPVPPLDSVDGVPLPAVPTVLTDFSTPPFDHRALAHTSATLAPTCDAVLVGEHHNRPDYPPTLLARMLLDEGCRPFVTLACRDRNRVVLEQELRGLRLVGVDAVLCVTGDGRGHDVRPEVTQVFDLDGPRLATLAAQVGVSAVVAETPLAPPVALRPLRLVYKQRCGASLAILNHVSRPADVETFVAVARRAGLTIPVLAAVAVYTDEPSAAALQGLPGLELDPATVAAVLGAPDPVAAGIAAAVDEARALLAIDGVVGVNVSGLGSARGWEYAAQVKAEIGTAIRAALRDHGAPR
jgi:methylenetetrahydrofolate reductase (NADPH)